MLRQSIDWKKLYSVRDRLKLNNGLSNALRFWITTVILGILYVGLTRISSLPDDMWIVAVISLSGFPLGLIWGLSKKIPLMTVAILTDLKAGTKEKISTALHFQEQNIESSFLKALSDQANETLQKIRTKEVIALPKIKIYFLPLLMCAVMAGLLYLPRHDYFTEIVKPKEKVAMAGEKEIKELKHLKKELKKAETKETKEKINKIFKDVDDLVERISEGNVEIRETVRRMNEIRREIKSIEKMLKARQDAIEELKKSELTKELAKALQSGDRERIKKALKELADELGKDNSLEKLNELKKALNKAIAKAFADEDLKDKLMAAKKSLEEGNIGEMSKKLAEAGKELKSNDSRKQAMKELAKASNEANDIKKNMVAKDNKQSKNNSIADRNKSNNGNKPENNNNRGGNSQSNQQTKNNKNQNGTDNKGRENNQGGQSNNQLGGGQKSTGIENQNGMNKGPRNGTNGQDSRSNPKNNGQQGGGQKGGGQQGGGQQSGCQQGGGQQGGGQQGGGQQGGGQQGGGQQGGGQKGGTKMRGGGQRGGSQQGGGQRGGGQRGGTRMRGPGSGPGDGGGIGSGCGGSGAGIGSGNNTKGIATGGEGRFSGSGTSGAGSTNLRKPASNQNSGTSGGSDYFDVRPHNKEGKYVPIYDPEYMKDSASYNTRVKGVIGKGRSYGNREVQGAPQMKESSKHAYRFIDPTYRRDNSEAVQNKTLPSELRDSVKKFFNE